MRREGLGLGLRNVVVLGMILVILFVAAGALKTATDIASKGAAANSIYEQLDIELNY